MLLGFSGFAGSGKDTAAEFLADQRRTDYGFVRIALADPLKRIARDVYAFTDEQLWGPSQFRNTPDKRYPRPCSACSGDGDQVVDTTMGNPALLPCFICHGERVTYLAPREALQKLGTEWGRECYPNTWVDLTIRTATRLLDEPYARYDHKKGVYMVACDHQSAMNSRTKGVAISDVRFRNEMQAIKGAGGKLVRIVRPGAGLDGSGALHRSETEQASIPDSEFDFVIQNTGTLDELREATYGLLR